jgi:pilus assembly protein Flp/PilA
MINRRTLSKRDPTFFNQINSNDNGRRLELRRVQLTGRRTSTGRDRAQTTTEQEHTMINLVKRFANDVSGATAIEYGLIAAGISVVIITVVNTLGSQLKSTFTNISTQLATAGK